MSSAGMKWPIDPPAVCVTYALTEAGRGCVPGGCVPDTRLCAKRLRAEGLRDDICGDVCQGGCVLGGCVVGRLRGSVGQISGSQHYFWCSSVHNLRSSVHKCAQATIDT